MIKRDIQKELVKSSSEYPVTTIIGPRQSGKTTLVQMAFPDKKYFSLEDPDIRMAAEADPRAFLNQLENGAILDEIQRLPILLSYIQGFVDKKRRPGQFILTGSHQPLLQEAISQSLAGRTAMLTLWPFSFSELRRYEMKLEAFDLIVKGFFPRLHENGLESRRFYNAYVQTYVERDLRSLVQLRDLSLFQKFLLLLAGRVGRVVNFASLSNDLGVSGTTVKNWLNVLKASYVVFELPPYFENIRKRVVKSPKIYFTDPGLAAFLLGIHSEKQAARDPLRGGLYENLAVVEIIKGALNKGIRPDVYFYRDSNGREVDLIIREDGRLTGVEIKSASTFSKEFLKGLEFFKNLGLSNTTPGVVLYNGDGDFVVNEARIANPLRLRNCWEDLIS